MLKKSPEILIVRNPLRIFFTSFKKSLQEKLYKLYIYKNTISDKLVLIIINQFFILEQSTDILAYAVIKIRQTNLKLTLQVHLNSSFSSMDGHNSERLNGYQTGLTL